MTEITSLPLHGALTGSEVFAARQGSGAVRIPLSQVLFKGSNGSVGTVPFDGGTLSGTASRCNINAGDSQSVYINTGANNRLVIGSGDGTIRPGADNAQIFGTGSNRWATIYAATGTINTSDAREKTDLIELTDAELRAARKIAARIGIFQWLDAIDEKGEGARAHVGVIAQEVIAAMECEGLDPFRYAFVCYDEWPASKAVKDDDGNVIVPARKAGNRYGIRYDQLAMFLIAAQEARLAALEAAQAE